MTVPLLHFSNKPLTSVYSVEQPREPDRKPMGLWVSWGDGDDSWPHWCRSENYCIQHLTHPTLVELASSARILRLESTNDIDAFHHEYVAGPDWYNRRCNIRWADVAKCYDGILIAPYIWDRRLSDLAGWYYSWDCASGCIWNADAIAALSDASALVKPHEAPTPAPSTAGTQETASAIETVT